jgi:uncharacterized membrane protein YedE/YeeE
MKVSHGHALGAFAAGLLFGVGLVLSGMTQPQKVLGFLDVFGRFDASLLFVMGGAVGVHALAYRLITRRNAPLFASVFALPTRRDVDAKLLLGAAIFGVGWGLSGYCPGPSIVSLAAGATPVVVFVLAMLAGMLITAKLEGAWGRSQQPSPPTAASGT